MENIGNVIQLTTQDAMGNILVLIVDYELKLSTLIEVNKNAADKLRVLSLQDYRRSM